MGELIHADLLFAPVPSLGNSRYAQALKDEKSKFQFIYFLKNKVNTVELFGDCFKKIENQIEKHMKHLRTNNGTEEINSEIENWFLIEGIIHELSCPVTPQQNGRIEREMRTLSEAVTTILLDLNQCKSMWAKAVS